MDDLWQNLSNDPSLFIPLILIGILGFIRWGIWLCKRIPALFYRPIINDFDATATIVTPVADQDPILFRRALDSWIANRPNRIITVIHVANTRCIEIVRTYPEVDLIVTDIPGRRQAIATGVDAVSTEIVVLADCDVIWEPDVLQKLKMPFVDPRMGGVGTRQHMYPSNSRTATLWEKLNDIYLDTFYSAEVPATVLLGNAVSCLSGRTAAYRTRLLKAVKETVLNETYHGRSCLSGEDKHYTYLALISGYKTWYQLNAHTYTTFSPTFRGFTNQRVGWSRNSFRSDLRALWHGWVWRYPYLALMLIDKSVTPFALVIGPVVLVLFIATGHWLLILALITWWLVSRTINVMPHLARKPGDVFILPAYLLIAYYVSLLRAYALITMNEHTHLTRDIPMTNQQATRG